MTNNNTLTSLTGLDNLTSIGGGLIIENHYQLTNLTGLDNLTSVGYIHIKSNHALTSLMALDKITSIGDYLLIQNNDDLYNLNGLDNVTYIGGDLIINHNSVLSNLTALDNLTYIGGDLRFNYNGALTSLTGLNNLTSIEDDLVIKGNSALVSLTGIDYIDAASIKNISITYNQLLSQCEVESVCAYLVNPNGDIDIDHNTIGCNSPEEVQDSCEANAVKIDEQYIKDNIGLYPNPAHQELNISVEGYTINEVTIYTLTGQQVLQERHEGGTIDISGLEQGIYVVEVIVENTRLRKKLSVQR